eukprot:PITA_14670
MYLASSSTHVDHEAWLSNLGASFHFTPHREWFYDYEKYDGGDVLLGDDRKARIIGRGKVKLKLQGGRVRTLLGVLHIPALAKNMISISKLDDAGVKIVFEKDTCNMVRGALALVENQTKKKIKVLRKDNGGKFYSKEFEEFCKKCGIAWQKATPYTHQQNGVAERMNKTLMERARSMLSGARLGQEFWVEVVDTACYLVNRSPSSALEDKTPQEVWTDVVFREVKDIIKHEAQPKELEKIEFELKEESEDEEPQTLGVRRSIRERRQPESYNPSAFSSIFSLSITDDDPRTVKEAVDSKDGKLRKEAMFDEMASLHKNEAWDLVELPTRRKPIGSKWVFKKKTNAEGKVEKYKARLVEKGYFKVPRIDFGDIFSPVAKVTSIRLLLFVVIAFDFQVE